MKFKIDENLPSELAGDLVQLGHESDSVVGEGLAGEPDSVILAAALSEARVLLTLDKGIASLVDYPPQKFSGIVLFRPDTFGRKAVLHFVRERLPDVLALDLAGRLIVVGATRIRIR